MVIARRRREPGSRPLPSCAPVAAALYCLKYQIAAMTESAGGGSIINNASLGGFRGIPGLAPYTPARHGVVA